MHHVGSYRSSTSANGPKSSSSSESWEDDESESTMGGEGASCGAKTVSAKVVEAGAERLGVSGVVGGLPVKNDSSDAV